MATRPSIHSPDPGDLEAVLADPSQAFDTPEDVVASPMFSRPQKIEILRRWEYEAREDDAATNEGMPGGDDDLLDQVHQGLGRLDAEIHPGREPLTRQGGVPAGAIGDAVREADPTEQIREAVAAFHETDAFEAAIEALQEHGFDRAAISVLAGEEAVREKLHRSYIKADMADDNPHTPRMAYVSRDSIGEAEGALMGGGLYLAAVPAAAAMIAGGGAVGAAFIVALLAGGVGAGVGGALAHIVGKAHAAHLEQTTTPSPSVNRMAAPGASCRKNG